MLIALGLASYFFSANVIYQWQDEDGHLYFSDRYQQGAQQLVLPTPQTYTPQELAVEQPIADVQDSAYYQKITITQPANDTTIRDNLGRVVVTMQVQPRLRNSDQVAIFLNGLLVQTVSHLKMISIDHIDRGTHALQVKILDEGGIVLAESAVTQFHLHRPRVGA